MVLRWSAKWVIFIVFLFLLQSTGIFFIITYHFHHSLQANKIDKSSKNVTKLKVSHSSPVYSSEEKITDNSNKASNELDSRIKHFRLLKEFWNFVLNDTNKYNLLAKENQTKETNKKDFNYPINQDSHRNLFPRDISLQNCSIIVERLKRKGFVQRTYKFFSKLSQSLKLQQPHPLPICPLNSPYLKGHISVKKMLNNMKREENGDENSPEILKLVDAGLGVQEGGVWAPEDCKGRQKVVVIVPYRSRKYHLASFVPYIHQFMQRQLIDYRVIVVEQQGKAEFNRGTLMNIGFKVAQDLQEVDCAIFHDLDLLPEHDYNFYRCGPMPRHMSVSVSSFGYKLPYQNLFGGIVAFSSDHFKKVNGFSNMYFGWGGEDDDLFKRVYLNGLQIIRYPAWIATYTMLNHSKQFTNPQRFELLRASTFRQDKDGLSTTPLSSCLSVSLEPLYTHVVVSLDTFYFQRLKMHT